MVLLIPIGLAIAGLVAVNTTTTDPQAEGEPSPGDDGDQGTEDDDEPGPDDGGGDAEVDPGTLELDDLEGDDRAWGELVTAIDASEQQMIRFQDEVAAALSDPDDEEDIGAAFEEISAAGAERSGQLVEIRERLAVGEGEPAAGDDVRAAYLDHLDAWVAWMEALEDDPTLLGSDAPEAEAFSLDINTTADDFATELDADLPDDLDDEVVDFARAILERGFSDEGDDGPAEA